MPSEATIVRLCAHMGAVFFSAFFLALGDARLKAAIAGDRLWFRAKRLGWGWVPATWEGWLVVAFFVAWTVLPTMILAKLDGTWTPRLTASWAAHAAVMTAALVGVCWRTGERPRWRWSAR